MLVTFQDLTVTTSFLDVSLYILANNRVLILLKTCGTRGIVVNGRMIVSDIVSWYY